MNTTFFPLTPILHPWVNHLTKEPKELFERIEQYGSPVNIHHFKPLNENIHAYQTVLNKYNVIHKIFFARKANKCLQLAQAVADAGQGVDTASFRELQQCLDAGIASEQLVLTAAVKNRQLFELALKHNVTVVLDNEDELELAQDVAAMFGKTLLINIRVGGFHVNGQRLPTRFGFAIDSVAERIEGLAEIYPHLKYNGLHFHLNGYSIDERVAAIEQSVQVIDALHDLGIHTRSLDIGGGILMNYLKSHQEWLSFHTALREAVLGNRPELTYQNDALGMVKIEDKLYGEPTVYPYFNEIHKEKLLEHILTAHSSIYGLPIHRLFTDRRLELRMEPGRSLLDQVGCTLAKVAFRKKDSEGRLLVGLEMNRTQLRSSSADFLLDPLHLPKQQVDDSDEPCYAYLVGSYCLEQELILKRQIKLQKYPEIGDLILFPNTAGYMMHFYESEAHLFELAKNVFI
ncbi:alanine racemase [Sphingobacterium sp. R2]|uniref:alanine racemase n=1 Tax=Sphingobacterium sp. R2 TaxID=3112958 RepID=UPI00345DD19C